MYQRTCQEPPLIPRVCCCRCCVQITKTSLMLGCGETHAEIRATLRDLRAHDVDVVTFGQYLRPTKRHMKVAEFVTPEAFDAWKREAEGMGFLYVASGPLVRSSYKAGELFLSSHIAKKRRAEASQEVAQQVHQAESSHAAAAHSAPA
jgi:lipoic acid synthetase